MEIPQQNIFNLKVYDVFIFPVSWLVFVIIGRAFFESGLGQYHSTHSKKWASLCKSLFLLTFVTCCTLLELVTFEILDLLHPALRIFIWTTSLGLLALLLNALIPAVLAISIGFHINFSVKASAFMGGVSVCLFQLLMWITESILHYCHSKFYSGDGIETYSNSGDMTAAPIAIKSFFLFDKGSANYVSDGGYLAPVLWALGLVSRFDVQRSIANIAVLGTVCAAIISGFATVFFPLEQLLIFRGVDAEQLRRRERTVSQLLREIATRKKEMLLMTKSNPPLLSTGSSQHSIEITTEYSEKNGDGRYRDEIDETKSKFSMAFDASADRDADDIQKKMMKSTVVPSEVKQSTGSSSAGSADFTLMNLTKSIMQLEELSTNLFMEIISMKEQQRMAEMARTRWGRIMRLCGQILTAVAVARLLVGAWHVLDHLRVAITVFRSEITDVSGSASGLDDMYSVGTIFSDVNRNLDLGVGSGTDPTMDLAADTDGYLEDPLLGGDTGGFLAGVGGPSKEERGDLVTTSLSFLLVHLKIDGTAWAPILSSIFIGTMALLQVRAFLVAMEQLARLGIMSTSTELYSLALALLTGFYFMSCVWQLSFQLPLRCRRGVTAALGETAPFELCFILFDAVFVVSTIVFGIYLWLDHRKKISLTDAIP